MVSRATVVATTNVFVVGCGDHIGDGDDDSDNDRLTVDGGTLLLTRYYIYWWLSSMYYMLI